VAKRSPTGSRSTRKSRPTKTATDSLRAGSRTSGGLGREIDFRLLFENAPGLFLVLKPNTPEFTILGASNAYLRATMTEREKITGRGLFDVFPDNPDDVGATGTSNLRASLGRALATKAPDTMAVQKYDIRRPESEGGGFEERFWSPVNAPVLSNGGDVRYILHRVEDVTEFVRQSRAQTEQSKAMQERMKGMELEILARSRELDAANKKLAQRVERGEIDLHKQEAFLQALIRNSYDAVHIINGEGVIIYSNEAVTRMLGWDVDEMVGHASFELVHPEDVAPVGVELQKIGPKPGASITQIVRVRHKNGNYRSLECIATNLLHDPAIGGIVVNFRDATERLLLEEQLRQASKLEAVGRLAGGVAHDFNNILSVIVGFAQFVLDGLPADSPQRADVMEIREAGERAAVLTRQLLAFSRKQVLQPVVLDINDVVGRMDKMLKRLIGEDVRLVTRLSEGLGRTRTDPGQLEQIIVNLAVNARDAMPQGGKLTIETGNAELDETYIADHPGAQAGPHVYIAMSDTGVGMDAATRERIFEPFFTTKGLGRGTGLGLSTVYGIVQQSGGAIWVYSEPGHGSTFKIYLPQVPDPAGGHRPKLEAPKSVGTETLLVVEDEPGVSRLVQLVLQGAGYKVLMAGSGPEAIELHTKNADIRLLLTDVVLPGMGGPAIAAEIQKRSPSLKVVYMSGYTDNAIVHHGVLDAGVNFLEKPLRPDVLLKKIRAVLDA
jgi:two-component system cell cycle sensor histidine kinase/response regulator CckA